MVTNKCYGKKNARKEKNMLLADVYVKNKKYSILNWDDNRISFATNRTDYTYSEACEALKEIALKKLIEYDYANDEEEAKDLYKALLDGKEEMASVGITEDCCSFTAYYENRYEIVETPSGEEEQDV